MQFKAVTLATTVLNMDNYLLVTVDSPVGRLTLVASPRALVAVRLPGTDVDTTALPANGSHPVLDLAADEIRRYFKGTLKAFTVPVSFDSGTEFQRAVWTAMASIPYGETRSYSWVARETGRPTAMRAVGRACGQNPVAIIVPCHRVIGVDGGMTGYAGGLDCKRTLLAHEQRNSLTRSGPNPLNRATDRGAV